MRITTRRIHRPAGRVVALAVAFAIGCAGVLVGVVALAGPAGAAAKLAVANEFGKAEADLTYSTSVTVTGSGYQSVKGGFGGIYVVFGWVKSGAWQPSKGGSVGNGDYLYVPDSESKDNQGFQKFVSFQGSETEVAANGGSIAADGSWKTTLVIPGPTFEAVARDGKKTVIDCRTVTCGVFTIGAHGVANGQNEVFTPIAFKSIYSSQPSTTPRDDTSGETGTGDPATGAGGAVTPANPEADAVDTGTAAVVVDRETAVVGRVLAFTATGFQEGEQLVAVLDDGIAAIGPLIAGVGGATAGVLQLPELAQAGTHTLKVTGAASGRSATASFPVRIAPEQATISATPVAQSPGGSSWPDWIPPWPIVVFVGLALAVFIAALIWRILSRRPVKAMAARNRSGQAARGREADSQSAGQDSSSSSSGARAAVPPAPSPPNPESNTATFESARKGE
ncbi:hypothetical protein GCM10010401_16470 [Rarobacter faecitabidus]|uniref:Uncharacterized protein n=1 Tax=Rarobacter faecitabidus TaxID=13243 RepID=A0A542ZX70_RARFA|nr:hypothetical protein [Rarobacter faecitabidus]TQL64951.1 hypothetical protein FB461_1483 [Rarobacter faecitabidus]